MPILLLLTAVGFLVYSNSLHSSFQMDDFVVILNNPAIHRLDPHVLWDAFNTRFIVGVTLALNYLVGGEDVFGYHVLNISAHILSSFLVYHFALQLFKTPRVSMGKPKDERLIALFAALVFLTHPLQTQAVNYIWQRAASLSTLFYLATLVLYLQFRLTGSLKKYWAGLLCAILAMYCKETTFTLPFAIMMIEGMFFGFKSDDRRWYMVPYLLTLVVIPLTLTRASEITLELMKPDFGYNKMFPGFSSLTRFVDEAVMPRKEYLLTQLNVLRTYLRMLVLPYGQNIDHDYPLVHRIWEPGVLFSIGCLTAVFGAGVAMLRKNRILSLCIFWFFLTLMVESAVPQMDVLFEHRLYLPMVGFGLFLAVGAHKFLEKKDLKDVYIGLMCSILAIFAFLSFQRNQVWQSELSLWDDAVSKSPHKARPHFKRGVAYEHLGRLDRAVEDYGMAIEVKPDYAKAYNNRGNVYAHLEKPELAIADFDHALSLSPHAKIYNNRGIAFGMKGDYDRAIQDFTKAIEMGGDLAEAYENRAIAYTQKGELELAKKDSETASRLSPAAR